jgi:hypothetical protein
MPNPMFGMSPATDLLDVVRGVAFARLFGRDETTSLGLSVKAQRILKAGVSAGSLADPVWAGNLSDMRTAAAEFLSRLDGASAIQAMLDLGIIAKAPFHINLLSLTQTATASVVGEGLPRPISEMALAQAPLVGKKIQTTIVLSRELISGTSASAMAWLSRQLRNAVALGLDQALIPELLAGVTPIASIDFTTDIAALLGAANKGVGRLVWLSSPDVGNKLALADSAGSAAPTGTSEYLNLPLFVSAGMAPGSLALINGNLIAANVEGFGLDSTTEATVNMDSAPSLPNAATGAPANLVSLWQSNSVGIGMTSIGDIASGPNGVALITGITWST